MTVPRLVRLAVSQDDQDLAAAGVRVSQQAADRIVPRVQVIAAQCRALVGGVPEPLQAALDKADMVNQPVHAAMGLGRTWLP